MSENKGVRHGQTGLSPRPSGILKDSNRANLPGSSPQLLKVKQPSEGKAKGDGDGKVQLCQEGTASPAQQDCEVHHEMARDILNQLVLTLPLPESPVDSKGKVAGTSGHKKALTTDDDPFQTRSKIPNSPQSRSSSDSSQSEALADNTKQGESLPCKGLPESSSSRPARQAAASASRVDASDLGGLDDMLSALASLRIGDEAQSAPAKAGPPPPLVHSAPADSVVCKVHAQDSSTDTAGGPKSGETDVPLKEELPAPKTEPAKTEPAEDSASASMQGAGDEDAVDPSKSRSGIPSSPALDDQGLDDSEISLNIPAGFDKAELTEELPESGVCLDSNSSEQAAQASGFANNSNGETGNLGDESAPENLNEESATGILHDQATEDSQSSTETEHLSIPAAANQLANSPAAPEADPFKPKSQLANSPTPAEADPFKPKSQLANSPAAPEADPFQPKSQLANSPAAPEADPFKPKTQLANSPAAPEADPFQPKSQLANSPLPPEADPFKPKTQLANSPAVPEADPFQPKSQLANSPVTEADPFKPKSQLANSPAAAQADPFKPKSQLANSPAVPEGDPFKPKTQLANSPAPAEGDPFQPKSQLANSPAAAEGDPFQPKSQLANSPAVPEGDPFQPKSQLANSPAAPEADPFKPKSQLANSPLPPEADPFQPKTQLANSPAPAEGDPFQPKSQLANSPAPAEGDPFKPKSQLANSPVTEADPFQPKSQLANSPGAPEGDPFKPKTQLANSPAAPEADPFKPKSQLANSPLAKGPAQPMEAVADPQSASEGSSASVAPDPPSTPCARGGVQDGKGADVDLMVPFTPMPSISAAAESKPQPRTELDRLLGTPMVGGDSGFSQQGLLTDQQLSLSDEVFVPASEVFKDSSTWEMLEKFGESGQKKKENDLARMSLYVKFDPLVQASRQPGSPRAGSTRSASARGKMDQSQDQSMMEEESILLMGTPPRNRGKHRSMMSHLRGNQNVSVVQRDVIEEEQAVDQFFSCSPAGDLPESQTCGVPTSASATDLAPVLAYTEAEMEEVKRALELAHQGELMKREGEWSREREALKKSCTKAKQELCKAHQDLAQIRSVIPEYEKVIESLIAEKEKADEHSKEEVERLKQERDSALEDVRSLEQTCSDVMKRYEKLRAIADGQKKNEEVMRKAVAADREKLKISEENCLKVKKAAEEKLAKQVEELQKAQSALAAESARREAAQRRIQSLEKALQQKDSENRELTQICDSLIAKTAT